MNDDLLDSQKLQTSIGIRLEEEKMSDLNPRTNKASPPKGRNSTQFKILKIERQAKAKVIINNILLILLFNVASFLVMASTFINKDWFLMAQTEKLEYWTNLLFIEKWCTQIGLDFPNIPSYCQQAESPVIFSRLMILFYYEGCSYESFTADDPDELCGVVASYYYSGLFASCAIFLGMILHIIHILQLTSIARYRNPHDIQGIHPLKIGYATVAFYTGAFLYWFLASATIINNNSSKPLLSRFGSSLWCYIGAVLFMMLLVVWLTKIYRKGIRSDLVTKLLEAEEKYILDSGSGASSLPSPRTPQTNNIIIDQY